MGRECDAAALQFERSAGRFPGQILLLVRLASILFSPVPIPLQGLLRPPSKPAPLNLPAHLKVCSERPRHAPKPTENSFLAGSIAPTDEETNTISAEPRACWRSPENVEF